MLALEAADGDLQNLCETFRCVHSAWCASRLSRAQAHQEFATIEAEAERIQSVVEGVRGGGGGEGAAAQ
eukprot:14946443-Alexandrium_andersonii.AAC.1